MSFNFAPIRLVILLVCVLVFYFVGGFAVPETTAAWYRAVIVFALGAVGVSLIDHRIGLMEPTNIRWLYVIVGVVLMAISSWWIQALKEVSEA